MKKTTWYTCSKHNMRYPKGGECPMCREEAKGGRGFYLFITGIFSAREIIQK